MLPTPPTSLERAVDRHKGERPFPRLAHCRGVGGVGGGDTDGGCTKSGYGVHDGVVAMRDHALRPEEGEEVLNDTVPSLGRRKERKSTRGTREEDMAHIWEELAEVVVDHVRFRASPFLSHECL